MPLATYSVGPRECSDLICALDTQHVCTVPPADWQVGALNSLTHVQAANTNETARALYQGISPEGVAEPVSSGSSHWSCEKAVNVVSKQSKGLPTLSPEDRWTYPGAKQGGAGLDSFHKVPPF